MNNYSVAGHYPNIQSSIFVFIFFFFFFLLFLMKLKSLKRSKIEESVKREIPLKNAIVENHCNTLRMNMAGNYAIEFRIFDNGIAYRFLTDKKGEIEVKGEDFRINFPADYLAHMSRLRKSRD